MLFKYVVLVAFIAILTSSLNAQQVQKRTCTTDANGTRTCTEYFAGGRSTEPKTDRVMGMSAKKYMRGVKSGKCMPTPSGACGGG